MHNLTKKELRKQILQLRNSLTDETRIEKSQIITNYIIHHPKFQSADCILMFASYKSEVDTTAIMEYALVLGKTVYFPRIENTGQVGNNEMEFYRIFSPEDLYEGYKGIREPKPREELRFTLAAGEKILILMPGAVFDMEGNRIGYGGGFYDRFLAWIEDFKNGIEDASYTTPVCTMALAFECQLVENGVIKAEEHDRKVDYIITEKREVAVKYASTKRALSLELYYRIL